MNYRIKHITEYTYSDPVQLCRNEACLLPRQTPCQQCPESWLRIVPEPSDLHERNDFFGNRVTHFAIQEPHERLAVTAVSAVAVTADPQPYLTANENSWEAVAEILSTEKNRNLLAVLPYLYDSPLIKGSQSLADYARPSFRAGRSLTDAVLDLTQRIFREFTYDPGFTSIATPLAEVLKNRRGVCQDFAHLAIGCLRATGLAARYVSGYIETLPPPGQARLIGADASHAWFSVYAPEAGWLDFDPTNNQMPAGRHITVAWGRDFSDVSPLKGVALGGGTHRMTVSVDVARLPDGAAA